MEVVSQQLDLLELGPTRTQGLIFEPAQTAPRTTNPSHAPSVSCISVGVMLRADAMATGASAAARAVVVLAAEAAALPPKAKAMSEALSDCAAAGEAMMATMLSTASILVANIVMIFILGILPSLVKMAAQNRRDRICPAVTTLSPKGGTGAVP